MLQGIDQVIVKEIACNCTELISLNLANLENIGRVAFQVFHFLSSLQTLDLTNNRNIDHNDMEHIGKLTKLKTLLLKNCTRVSFHSDFSTGRCIFSFLSQKLRLMMLA